MPIERVTVVVIGAGHTGLAVSRMLTERSIEHVVLERRKLALKPELVRTGVTGVERNVGS